MCFFWWGSKSCCFVNLLLIMVCVAEMPPLPTLLGTCHSLGEKSSVILVKSVPFPSHAMKLVFPLPEAHWLEHRLKGRTAVRASGGRRCLMEWGQSREGNTSAELPGFEFNPDPTLGKLIHLFMPGLHCMWHGALIWHLPC